MAVVCTCEHIRFQRDGCVLIPLFEVGRTGIVPMAAHARAGSVVVLLALLVIALAPLGASVLGPKLAPGLLAVDAASGSPHPAPADAVSAYVSPDRSAADVGQSITFACSASGGTPPYVYAWAISDGGIAAGPTVDYSFGSPGTYDATCTVTDLLLGIAMDSTSVVISPTPSVAASVDHDLAAPGMTLTFGASPSGGDGSFTFEWAFGDGSSGSGAPATYAYSQAGSYQATVTATDGNGGTASSSVSVTISDIGVTAGVSPTSGDLTTVFTFTATASGGGGSPYSFSWNFGDGATGSGPSVTHFYTAGGTYSPEVTATDGLGGSHAAPTQTVTVTAPPAPLGATANAPRQAADVGQSVTFTCPATGGTAPYPYGWTFGDGNPGSGPGLRVGHDLQCPGDRFGHAGIGPYGHVVRVQCDRERRGRPTLHIFMGLRGRPVRWWLRGVPQLPQCRQLLAARPCNRFVGREPDGLALADRSLVHGRRAA